MLAIDISGSMDIKNVKPNRLEAAKQAAWRLPDELPTWVKVGLVSFSENAVLNAPLTPTAMMSWKKSTSWKPLPGGG